MDDTVCSIALFRHVAITSAFGFAWGGANSLRAVLVELHRSRYKFACRDSRTIWLPNKLLS